LILSTLEQKTQLVAVTVELRHVEAVLHWNYKQPFSVERIREDLVR
jgi:hypothetical protein